jgi:prolyl-tRNA synthetase
MKVLDDPFVEPLDDAAIQQLTRADVGFAGPVGLPPGTPIIADHLVETYEGMIVGANATDAHYRGVKMGRDFEPTSTAHLSQAQAGDTCKRCGKSTLELRRGVEMGHIFKLDTKYSKSMKATFLDADGKDQHFVMGCYGFGVSRAVAAAIEARHDERGIVWPRSITPFHALVLPINVTDEVTMGTAESIYDDLAGRGWDVLLDDRDVRAGFKFKDADLIGVPLRVTLGERNLKEGKVELYYRADDRTELISPDEVHGKLDAFYAAT